MFPMVAAAMHRDLERAADRFGSGPPCWPATIAGPSANSTSAATPSPATSPPGACGAGDRVALMTTNRVEFVIAVYAVSKLGAAAVLLSPAWKSTEVRHALELTAPVHAVADGDAASLLADVARATT